MFAIVSHFHLVSLTFEGNAKSLYLVLSLLRVPTQVGFYRAYKYKIRVEVTITLAYYSTEQFTAVKSSI